MVTNPKDDKAAETPAPAAKTTNDDVFAKLKEYAEGVPAKYDGYESRVANSGILQRDEESQNVYVAHHKDALYSISNSSLQDNDYDTPYEIVKGFETILTDMGFTVSHGKGFAEKTAGEQTSGIDETYYAKDGYICTADASSASLSLQCVTSDDVTEGVTNGKLFYDAYTGDEDYQAPTTESAGDIFVDADTSEVKDGPTGYQTVTGSVGYVQEDDQGIFQPQGGSPAYFYRKTDGDWNFFATTQGPQSCEAFKADEEERVVFADQECFASNTSTETTTIGDYYKQ
jgi:hypothetical protein